MVHDLCPEVVPRPLEDGGDLEALVAGRRDLELDDGDLVPRVLVAGAAAPSTTAARPRLPA